MEYTTLGNSGIRISRFCVGCMSFGDPASKMHAWTLNPEESEAIIKQALDLGVNFFDTANIYSAGTSEEYLGRAIKKHVPRSEVVLASKVYFNDGHLSKAAIDREIDGTLQRLGTDYLDLYIIHRFDHDTPMEETMEALHGLVTSGKVRALGASAMYGYQFYNLQMTAERNGWTKFVSMQNHYNLLYREDERELIPICNQMNVARTPYSPLAAGRLSRLEWKTDTLRSQTDKTAISKYDSTQETDYQIVMRVHELAQRKEATMTQIALAWQLSRGVAAPIIGATKPKYFIDAVGALNVSLTPEDVAYLEEPYIPHKIVGAI
ncbi:MAG: aldo/keto reductase [Eubacteriales bacterium]|nr:aldo/keto reductase [Eubacteriales bacterium]